MPSGELDDRGSASPARNQESGLSQRSGPEEEIIEGGRITLSPDHISWKDRHESETAKTLTFLLVGTLIVSLVIHYVAVIVFMLIGHKDAVEVLTSVFDKWLPVISSFVVGAVTFYLSRRKG
jgi:hypothetical protein